MPCLVSWDAMQDEESSKISDSSARIGSVIKSARIERGLTIEQASERLRITTFYLSKIEGGEFSDLPAPAYVAGFLRSYAQLLELDSELIVGRYFALNGKQSILQNYKCRKRSASAALWTGYSFDSDSSNGACLR